MRLPYVNLPKFDLEERVTAMEYAFRNLIKHKYFYEKWPEDYDGLSARESINSYVNGYLEDLKDFKENNDI